jgi:hypothetical protein
MNLVCEVAKDKYHKYAEHLEVFRTEIQAGIDVGGTAEEYLSHLLTRVPDSQYDIKTVRATLQKLAAKGVLKVQVRKSWSCSEGQRALFHPRHASAQELRRALL